MMIAKTKIKAKMLKYRYVLLFMTFIMFFTLRGLSDTSNEILILKTALHFQPEIQPKISLFDEDNVPLKNYFPKVVRAQVSDFYAKQRKYLGLGQVLFVNEKLIINSNLRKIFDHVLMFTSTLGVEGIRYLFLLEFYHNNSSESVVRHRFAQLDTLFCTYFNFMRHREMYPSDGMTDLSFKDYEHFIGKLRVQYLGRDNAYLLFTQTGGT
jgi:hypothetical protein